MSWRLIFVALLASVLAGCGEGGTAVSSASRVVPPVVGSVNGSSVGTTGKTFFVAYDTDTISGFDEGSMDSVAQIKTPGPNVLSLTLSPNESTLYAATGFNGAACFSTNSTLLAINTASFQITTSAAMPGAIVALAAGANVLVGAAHESSGTSYLYVIDPASLALLKKITLPVLAFVNSNTVVLTNDGSVAFVSGGQAIVRVDISAGTATVFHQFSSTTDGPYALALDATDQRLYADTLFGIPIFGTTSGSQIGNVGLGTTGQWYERLAETPDKTTIVANGLDTSNQPDGTVISSASGTIINRIVVSADYAASDVGINALGTEGFFFDWGGSGVYAYNLASGALIGSAGQNDTNSYIIALAAE